MRNILKFGFVFVVLAGFQLTSSLAIAKSPKLQQRNCKPAEVAVFANRLHVRCYVIKSQAYTSDIPYYAMSLSGATVRGSQVALTLQVLLAAKANNQTLRIWFDTHDYASVPGCRGGNCRRLAAVAIK